MKISAQEEYGLRCVIQLASDAPKSLSAVEIAAREGISVAYVSKLLNIFKRIGLVKSERGVKGGYRLGRPAAELTLADVIKPLSGQLFDTDFCECFPGLQENCVHYAGSCSLRSVWSVLAEHINGVLASTTLLELVTQEEPLMRTVLRQRLKDQAVSSAGFVRYALRKSTASAAPRVRKRNRKFHGGQ